MKVSVSDCGIDRRLLPVARDLLGGHPAAAVLAADHVGGDLLAGLRRDRAQDLDLLVAQRVGVEARRRLHRDEADELHQVVLEEVPDRPGLLVERAAGLDPDRLGHGDLHVVDIAAVPDRLEDAVAEPEDEQVPDRLLAQVVVDPVDLLLAEDLAHFAVEADRRLEVAPERLLDDDPAPAAAVHLVVEAGPAELADDLREGRRLRREVVEAVAGGPLLLVVRVEVGAQVRVRGGIVEVGLEIGDPLRERIPDLRVERQHPAVLVERGLDLGPERSVGVRPPADRHEHELVGQQVRPPELEQGRDDLAVGQVAGPAEEDEHERVGHPLEAQAFAERVLEALVGRALRLALGRPGEAQVAHRARHILGRFRAGGTGRGGGPGGRGRRGDRRVRCRGGAGGTDIGGFRHGRPHRTLTRPWASRRSTPGPG